jgi:hypothetical protein
MFANDFLRLLDGSKIQNIRSIEYNIGVQFENDDEPVPDFNSLGEFSKVLSRYIDRMPFLAKLALRCESHSSRGYQMETPEALWEADALWEYWEAVEKQFACDEGKGRQQQQQSPLKGWHVTKGFLLKDTLARRRAADWTPRTLSIVNGVFIVFRRSNVCVSDGSAQETKMVSWDGRSESDLAVDLEP